MRVEGLRVRYGAHVAVDGVDLQVAPGEVLCVLGPSGCGKSTLLRSITGLVPPDAGTVWWGDEELTRVPVHRRSFGLMFQDHALFPHASVGRNVSFGLRMQRRDRAETRERVDELLTMVGLEGAAGRSVGELSGGEQQRVALARALAPDPRLLLLDEPLGALDRGLRDRLVSELRSLFDGLGTAVLYVTHDQDEALTIADRLAVMRGGQLLQVGTPIEVWRRPADAFVARFLGATNVISADVVGGVADFGIGSVPVPALRGPVDVVVRRDALVLDPEGELVGEVVRRRFIGDVVSSRVRVGDHEVDISLDAEPVPAIGERVRLRLDVSRVLVLGRGD